jgi:hypothetical protein
VNLWLVAFPGMAETYFPAFWKLLEKNAYIDGTNYQLAANYMPTVVYLLVIGGILVSLAAVCESGLELLSQVILLALGLATRMVMGFSPTIYVSQERTFFFLYMALGVSAVALALRNLPLLREKKRCYGMFQTFGVLLLIFSVVMNLTKIGAA